MTNFKKIFPRLCSCGNELGVLQSTFENSDKNVTEMLNELKIYKICCRKTIICSPVSIITSSDLETYRDEINIRNKFKTSDADPNLKLPIVKNNEDPDYNPFPIIPGTIINKPIEKLVMLPPANLPKLIQQI